MAIYIDFVTAPYAASGIKMAMLFFDSGLGSRSQEHGVHHTYDMVDAVFKQGEKSRPELLRPACPDPAP